MLSALLILLIVIFDQISKQLAVLHLKDAEAISFIPGLLSFRYHENSGAAWGMLSEHRWVFMTVSSFAILAIIGFFVYCRIKNEKLSPLLITSLSFFCGGGIGNMIDRFFLGYVVDFLRFDFIDFPIFNVADSFISIGACLMVLYLLIETVNEYKEKKKNAPDEHKL